ncbi:hypothetical protein ORD22_08025 [Sporosarcina sp. GW1-11]|uniref:hypothetical protein n=1 Tax=Sporosarcina sp. GW1-11 TaxID=2899126 RepID=UPI00294C452B|nr:hypothetical protein [Sporosarcina sp. GW1-11]MDV6378194.1 hypothetical protein [Sporosarcina sp. GW1-11]
MKIKFAIVASSLALLLSGCFGGSSDSDTSKETNQADQDKNKPTEQTTDEKKDAKIDGTIGDKTDETVDDKKEENAKNVDPMADRYNYARHGNPIEVKGRVALKENAAEVKKNKNVEAVEVFEQNGTVFAEVNAKKDATDKEVKDLTAATVNQLKDKHPKKPITVTVVKDEKKVSETNVDQDKVPAAKTVGSVNGLAVLDPILQTYIIRITAEEVPAAKPEDTLVLTVNGEDYVMEYDKERDLYQNSIIKADNVDQVKNATFIIKSK